MRALLLAVLLACKGNSPPPAPAPAPAVSAAPAVAASIAPDSSRVRVDRRVELLSILHRLIGHKAYTSAPATPYVQAVDKTFGPFANHPAVAATRALRASHSITWDAPMMLAVHLDDQLQLRNPRELPDLDPRFAGADVWAYAETLRAFARDTRLDEFLASQQPYISQVEAKLQKLLDDEKPLTWFDRFFGAKQQARYIVVPGLLTGTHNMGVRANLPDGTEEIYQVLGIHADDGMPTTDEAAVALLVHEMAHSYVNPLIQKHRAALEPSGTKLFAVVAEAMKKQAYDSWKTFVDESVVRAVVVVYLYERKGVDAANAEGLRQVELAFRWTPDLVKLLLVYFRPERTRYVSFETFMPEVIKTFDGLAAASGQGR